jgi:hypothetical protein
MLLTSQCCVVTETLERGIYSLLKQERGTLGVKQESGQGSWAATRGPKL